MIDDETPRPVILSVGADDVGGTYEALVFLDGTEIARWPAGTRYRDVAERHARDRLARALHDLLIPPSPIGS